MWCNTTNQNHSVRALVNKGMLIIVSFVLFVTACTPPGGVGEDLPPDSTLDVLVGPTPTQLPDRPNYAPGELVEYIAQTGDTLPALASHFHTTEAEIRAANPQIPADATTMPPGMPMQIPIYYLPFWGSPFKIIPDSHFINGPAGIDFDTTAFVASRPGWLKDYRTYAAGASRSGAEVVDLVAMNFSVSPRVLLAILEYQTGALSQPEAPDMAYPLGYRSYLNPGIYLQLVWAANTLNNAYYGWRTGSLSSFEHQDGRLERPDPWQNAASVAFQYYFSRILPRSEYGGAIGPEGIAHSYRALFGDPWGADQAHIPVSLQQPVFLLPFTPGEAWTYTGGPHTGWGQGEPLAGIDFAPPAVVGGCAPSERFATAIADGFVIRSEPGIIVQDLDGDNDARTGWVIFYLHVATERRAALGAELRAGDPIGYPSCEGGRTTGTHIHIARLYNGEWIPADGPLALNLEGWVAHNGAVPYQGTLTRGSRVVTACDCSDPASQIRAGE